MAHSPVPGSTRRPLSPARRRLAAVVYVAYFLGLAALFVGSFIHQGLKYNSMRDSPGATVVTLTVTRVDSHCSKSCSYESVGSYVDPGTHEVVTTVGAVPNFSEPAYGPLQVIVSPAYRREAIRADYTGTGDIAAGCVALVIFASAPLGLVAAWVQVRRRRARPRATMAKVTAGESEPTGRFEGILRGPGISSVVGMSSIELTPTDLIEYETHIGGAARWQVPLIDVTAVEENVRLEIDAPVRMGWQTIRFHTSNGSFTLTCDPLYSPLLLEAFRRHAPSAPAAPSAPSAPAAEGQPS